MIPGYCAKDALSGSIKVLGKKAWILIQHLPRCFFKAEITFWKSRVDLLHLRLKERLGSRRDETVADLNL